MTDAFRCDVCLEFFRGDSHTELYEKRHQDYQGTEHVKVADVCSGCAADIPALEGDDGEE